EGHAAARGHRAGARPRPGGGVPGRADERPRPDRAQGDPRPDPAPAPRGQDGVHEHPHPVRRGDDLRPGRDHREGRDPLRGAHRVVPGRRARERRGARARTGGAGRRARAALRAPARQGRDGGAPRARQAARRGAAAGAGVGRRGGVGDSAPRLARDDLPVGGAGRRRCAEGGRVVISPVRVAVIAANTVREAVRSKVLYTLVFFAVLLIGTGVLLSMLTYVEGQRILQSVGLAAIRLFGAAIAIFVGIGLIHREVERRTIFTILSKPVTRSEFLLGKYAGLVVTIWLQVLVMGAAFAAVSLLAGAPLP